MPQPEPLHPYNSVTTEVYDLYGGFDVPQPEPLLRYHQYCYHINLGPLKKGLFDLRDSARALALLSPILLQHKSRYTKVVFDSSALARAITPLSPILLELRPSLFKVVFDLSAQARAFAPSSLSLLCPNFRIVNVLL